MIHSPSSGDSFLLSNVEVNLCLDPLGWCLPSPAILTSSSSFSSFFFFCDTPSPVLILFMILFPLSNVEVNLCLDPLGRYPPLLQSSSCLPHRSSFAPTIKSKGTTKPPSLKQCVNGAAMQWTYSPSTRQFASVATRACQAPSSKGKQCHVCLDLYNTDTVDLWDCKDGSAAGNQQFSYDSKLLGVIEGSGEVNESHSHEVSV